MIGYLIEQELSNLLPADSRCATLLTQVEIDPRDPAFENPSKPIGPVYDEAEAQRLAAVHGWAIAADGESFRRVVPSPRPLRILEQGVIELLVEQGVVTQADLDRAVAMPLKKGEFFMFHAWVLHGSGINNSDRRRAGPG